MQRDALPALPLLQPFVRLTQSNLQAWSRFSASPEMVSLFMTNAQRLFWSAPADAAAMTKGEVQKLAAQAHENVSRVAQSAAFAELLKGLTQNYMQFLFELGQAGMKTMGQEQVRLMHQLQEMPLAMAQAVAKDASSHSPRSK